MNNALPRKIQAEGGASPPGLVWHTLSGAALRYTEASNGNARFLVAGIVNVTPDSFSDGGKHFSTAAAVAHAHTLVSQGADIIDFGGESTRPGAGDIGGEEELRRLLPVLRQFVAQVRSQNLHTPHAAQSPPTLPNALNSQNPLAKDPVISVDTYRASTASALLQEQLVTVVNDISGCALDPAMGEVLAAYKPGYVLGHCPLQPRVMQENPQYGNIVDDLLVYFETHMAKLVRLGLPEENIVLDPCVGFAKSLEHNLPLLQGASRFHSLGRPLYYGISRKSFLKPFLGENEDREVLTQVATSLLASQGVQIHRVHDVAAARKTLHLTGAVCGGVFALRRENA